MSLLDTDISSFSSTSPYSFDVTFNKKLRCPGFEGYKLSTEHSLNIDSIDLPYAAIFFDKDQAQPNFNYDSILEQMSKSCISVHEEYVYWISQDESEKYYIWKASTVKPTYAIEKVASCGTLKPTSFTVARDGTVLVSDPVGIKAVTKSLSFYLVNFLDVNTSATWLFDALSQDCFVYRCERQIFWYNQGQNTSLSAKLTNQVFYAKFMLSKNDNSTIMKLFLATATSDQKHDQWNEMAFLAFEWSNQDDTLKDVPCKTNLPPSMVGISKTSYKILSPSNEVLIKHDLYDACQFKLAHDERTLVLEHVHTFPAMHYVWEGKSERKAFLSVPFNKNPKSLYCLLVDRTRLAYAYGFDPTSGKDTGWQAIGQYCDDEAALVKGWVVADETAVLMTINEESRVSKLHFITLNTKEA